MELGFHRLRCLAADIWAHLGICRASFPPVPPAACATWASREATRRRSALRSLATASSAFLRSERSSGWRSRRLESSHCLALPRTCSKSCARPAPSCESSSQQTPKPLPPHPPPPESLVPGGSLLHFLPQTFSNLPNRNRCSPKLKICTNSRRDLPPAWPAKVHPPPPSITCWKTPRVTH